MNTTMNRLWLLFLWFIVISQSQLLLVISGADDEPDCEPVPVCANFEHTRVGKDEPPPADIGDLESEGEIAKSWMWGGVVPVSYKLDLNFLNHTHYTGSVDISFKLLTSPFVRLMINHGAVNPSIIDYKAITIRRLCSKSPMPSRQARFSSPPLLTRCIEKTTFLEANETLILALKEVDFKPGLGYRYAVSFPYFEGRSEGEKRDIGATGLSTAYVAEEDAGGPGYSATTTIFQMRYARTVFPCFDHPSLKARFKLCIERPSRIEVASNTLPLSSDSVTIDGEVRKKRDCFQQTLRLPTYVFTFALMENYTSKSVRVPAAANGGGTEIAIFAPDGFMDRFNWMFEESIAVVQYLERITDFKFPLKRLGFVVTYPAPFWGVENFGLVTVEGGFMQSPTTSETAYTILYHEIVHQWLGDVVTISEWREICLQEGLTAYFEWKISADRRNGSLDNKAHAANKKADDEKFYKPYLLREYKKTQDIADWCYGRPAVFFHAVTKRYGFEAIERFLKQLIKQRPYGTADIRRWDKLLNEVTTGESNDMKGYLEGWFLEPGPVYLLMTKIPNSDCILIRQKYDRTGGKKNDSTDDDASKITPRIMPIDVEIYQASDGNSSSIKTVVPVFLRSLETKVCNISTPTFLVDPDAATMTRKVYTSEIYRSVLELRSENPEAITNRQLDTFVDQFCKSLTQDVFPIQDESPDTTPADWLEVYALMKNSTLLARTSICWCCMSDKEENQNTRACLRSWDRYCSGLRLTHYVGYNYNFTQEEIWGK